VNCRILQGSVFDRLPEIQAGSIDCAVTSPPYWMLRSYLPKDHPLKPLDLSGGGAG
jgi:DNA modification methylase